MHAARVSSEGDRLARIAAVRARFEASGTSVTDWAKRHGFKANAVHQILANRGSWKRGKAHEIAVALGLKEESAAPAVVSIPLAGHIR